MSHQCRMQDAERRMRSSTRRALGGLVLAFCILTSDFCIQSRADSIWSRSSPRYGYLFIDNRARQIGDTLTLILSETTAIGQREARQASKATTISDKFAFKGKTASDNAGRSGEASMDASNESNRTFNGSAGLTSSRVYTDRMAVTVVDVLPNGNLVVEGHRIRVISGEKRILRITGVVKPADLSPANTVFSEAVANFKIEYWGCGVDTEWVNQGWFGRFWNFVWPF